MPVIKSAAPAKLATEFEAFLLSSVGEDDRGMGVSVLSSLARSNIDPWQEAALLATLPADAAIRRLTTIIEALADPSLTLEEASAVASRLIGRLPHAKMRSDRDVVTKRTMPLSPSQSTQYRAAIVAILIFTGLMLGAQYFLTDRGGMARAADGARPSGAWVATQTHQ